MGQHKSDKEPIGNQANSFKWTLQVAAAARRPLALRLTRCVVIEEEQGLRSGGDDVVHAHGHQVDTHGVMLVAVECELELGAHAVGACYQVGIPERHQAAETADAGVYLLDSTHELVASIDIHACMHGWAQGNCSAQHCRQHEMQQIEGAWAAQIIANAF